MGARNRIVAVCLAVLTLAFSCHDAGSYIVDTTESGRIVTVLSDWASERGFVDVECAEYANFPTAIQGTCYEMREADGVMESVLLAEAVELEPSVRVWISFKATARTQQAKILESLGAALESEFGPGNVRPEK